MAAHLDLTLLRRHALPAHFMAGLRREANRPAVPRPAPSRDGRPRLIAAWRLDAGGRPVCTRSVDAGEPV